MDNEKIVFELVREAETVRFEVQEHTAYDLINAMYRFMLAISFHHTSVLEAMETFIEEYESMETLVEEHKDGDKS